MCQRTCTLFPSCLLFFITFFLSFFLFLFRSFTLFFVSVSHFAVLFYLDFNVPPFFLIFFLAFAIFLSYFLLSIFFPTYENFLSFMMFSPPTPLLISFFSFCFFQFFWCFSISQLSAIFCPIWLRIIKKFSNYDQIFKFSTKFFGNGTSGLENSYDLLTSPFVRLFSPRKLRTWIKMG
jgi:hypothetical protein